MPINSTLKKKKETTVPEEKKTTTSAVTNNQSNNGLDAAIAEKTQELNNISNTATASTKQQNSSMSTTANATAAPAAPVAAPQTPLDWTKLNDTVAQQAQERKAAASTSTATNNAVPPSTAAASSTPTTTATTETEETGNIYKVQPDGTAPAEASVGDKVVTNGGTYIITGKDANGNNITKLIDSDTTARNYTGDYTLTNEEYDNYVSKLESESGADTNRPVSNASSYDASAAYSELESILNQANKSAQAQIQNQIDRATQQSIADKQSALDNAIAEYRTQQNAVNINEAQDLDNSALYAELRGDKGGIGQAQYNSIQNQAASNIQAINTAQQNLANDTANDIAQLRADGEYEKAQALLELNQSYLSQLMEIKQAAINGELTQQQYEESVREWQASYDLEKQQYTDSVNRYIDETAYSRSLQETEAAQTSRALAQSEIENMLERGVSAYTILNNENYADLVSESGWNAATINEMYNNMIADNLASAAKSNADTSSTTQKQAQSMVDNMIKNGNSSEQISDSLIKAAGYTRDYVDAMTAQEESATTDIAEKLFTAASKSVDPAAYIRLNAKNYGITNTDLIASLVKSYNTWKKSNTQMSTIVGSVSDLGLVGKTIANKIIMREYTGDAQVATDIENALNNGLTEAEGIFLMNLIGYYD